MLRAVSVAGCALTLSMLAGCTSKPPPRSLVTWYPAAYAPQPPAYILPGMPLAPSAPPAYAPAAYLPRFARVAFVGLLAGPGKVDGTQWDGPGGAVSREDWQQVAVALGAANPYAAVIGVFAGPTLQALEKPDCGGSAVLTSSAGTGTQWTLTKKQDTFTPQWGATWDHVPLDGTARIRVEVIDHDLFFNDPMGIFEVPSASIHAALAAGKVLPVRVEDQTNRQILFALISAQAE